jgi:hypothetical protein
MLWGCHIVGKNKKILDKEYVVLINVDAVNREFFIKYKHPKNGNKKCLVTSGPV